MPIGAAAIIGAASIYAGQKGAEAAKEGAQQQAAASRYAADMQKQMFDVQNEQQKPYREAGYTALGDIAGMKPYLTKQFSTEDFYNNIDPGYAWRLSQGQQALDRQRNAAGGSIGGNTLTAMQDYTQGQASQEYGNAFNRYQTQRSNIYNTLASIAGLGQTSLGQTTNASVAAGGNIGQAIQNAGAATGAGTVGAANAMSGGIQGAGNAYYLSNLLKPQAQTTASSTYSPSGPSFGGANYDVTPASTGGIGLQIRT